MWTEDNTIEQLVEGVIRHGPEVLSHCQSSQDLTNYLSRIQQERLNYPTPTQQINSDHWFIPKSYQDLDIEQYLVSVCPKEHYQRLVEELSLFNDYNMIPVLKTMKYIVDTLKSNNIVWGVGRGSSVASYVLYLIGVHRVDSIKYNLPIEEFFKGDTNG
jgi:DNA polymerase III alpha subunit